MRNPFRALLLALLLTAACAGPPTESVVAPTEAPVTAIGPLAASATVPAAAPTLAGAATQPAAALEATGAVAAPTAVEPAVGAVTAAPPAETRAPRLALEATDPATVRLAAGKPQLVEFFAFW